MDFSDNSMYLYISKDFFKLSILFLKSSCNLLLEIFPVEIKSNLYGFALTKIEFTKSLSLEIKILPSESIN